MIKKRLVGCSERELLRLIHDLYDLGVDNRNFLYARYGAVEEGIGSYVAEIQDAMLSHTLSDGRPSRLPDIPRARKLIKQYKKASDDARGVAELLFAFLEVGLEFTKRYSHYPDEFIQAVAPISEELFTLLHGLSPKTRTPYYARLRMLVQDVGAIESGFPEAWCVHFLRLFSEEADILRKQLQQFERTYNMASHTFVRRKSRGRLKQTSADFWEWEQAYHLYKALQHYLPELPEEPGE
jgi:hypothetical protein